jgi:hypothetical protein
MAATVVRATFKEVYHGDTEDTKRILVIEQPNEGSCKGKKGKGEKGK